MFFHFILISHCGTKFPFVLVFGILFNYCYHARYLKGYFTNTVSFNITHMESIVQFPKVNAWKILHLYVKSTHPFLISWKVRAFGTGSVWKHRAAFIWILFLAFDDTV